MEYITLAFVLQIHKNTSPQKKNETLLNLAVWLLLAAGAAQIFILGRTA